jgi:dinuclear metal center YbgI/SA1388 family protein
VVGRTTLFYLFIFWSYIMSATLADIVKIMESLAPSEFAEEWDNVGLQLGQMDWPVRTVWVALDPLLEVVAEACRNNVDVLITHHPLIFRPLRSINFSTPVGTIIQMAARNRLAIFAAHSNLDSVDGGINDVLAAKIGLTNLKALRKIKSPARFKMAYDVYPLLPPDMDEINQPGLGRVGELNATIELLPLARSIKKKLSLKSIKVAGKPDLPVSRVAVCSGSGSSLMSDFFESGAQVFVSGDLKYHDAREVEAANLGLIDIGHFTSEHLMVEILAQRLNKALSVHAMEVHVEACGLEKDPFMIL